MAKVHRTLVRYFLAGSNSSMGELLVLEVESEVRRIKLDRARDVRDLIADAVHTLHEGMLVAACMLCCLLGLGSCHGRFSFPALVDR
jgi:hypothetical protein